VQCPLPQPIAHYFAADEPQSPWQHRGPERIAHLSSRRSTASGVLGGQRGKLKSVGHHLSHHRHWSGVRMHPSPPIVLMAFMGTI